MTAAHWHAAHADLPACKALLAALTRWATASGADRVFARWDVGTAVLDVRMQRGQIAAELRRAQLERAPSRPPRAT